jgi:hypothetical protein
MALNDSDLELGRRLARILEARRPVTLGVTMSIVEDLMAADVSLLPALQILASQPIFVQFINSRPDSFLLPLKDSLVAAAADTLSPPLLNRIQSFLNGYMGISTPAKLVAPLNETPRPSAEFPSFVKAGAAGFPATEIADYNRSSSRQDHPEPTLLSSPSVHQHLGAPGSDISGSTSQLERTPQWRQFFSPWVGIPLLAVIGWLLLFKIPAVCSAFDLCSDPPKSNSKDKKPLKTPVKKSGSTTSGPREVDGRQPAAQSPPETSPIPAAPPRYVPPAPRYVQPQRYEAPPPPAQESRQPSSVPLRDEPLW